MVSRRGSTTLNMLKTSVTGLKNAAVLPADQTERQIERKGSVGASAHAHSSLFALSRKRILADRPDLITIRARKNSLRRA